MNQKAQHSLALERTMRYGSSRDFAAGNIYVGPSSLDKRAEEIVKDTTLWSELQKELKSKRAVTSSSYHQVIQTFLAHRFVQQTSEANERVRRKRLLAMKQKSEPVLRGTRSTTESSAQSQRRLHNHEDTQQRCTISSSSMRRVSCESKILSHIVMNLEPECKLEVMEEDTTEIERSNSIDPNHAQ